ncbi:MAG TPA: porin family protein [Flavobacteriaceae bacterium]|nr:porin family protein [Flavobacteriaceae bacterium]
MKKQLALLIVILGKLLFTFLYAQNDSLVKFRQTSDSIVVQHTGLDQKYLEDQFYIGLTFNLMDKMSKGISQSGFSGGFHVGYIRDIPLNKRRNFGLGVGLGWSFNSYRTNLMIGKDRAGNSIFQVLNRNKFDYNVNRFSTYLIEMPLQVRWRTSTADSYKFWRIYTGLRLGYIYYFNSKFEQPGKNIYQTKVDGLQRFRYGLSFTFGYNTFNFTVYYSLNSFFKNVSTLEGQPVELTTFKVGLEFYIL